MTQPLSFALLTQFPFWMWWGCGMLLALPGCVSPANRLVVGMVAALWCLAFALLDAEPRALGRQVLPLPAATGALRVVSLNAAGGSRAALQEALALQPDIVLLQEAPPQAQVEALVEKHYTALALGPDACVLAKGSSKPLVLPPALGWHARGLRLQRRDGREVVVVSLRLDPPPLRFELFSADAWQAMAHQRERQQVDIAALVGVLQHLSADLPVIVGGDCNTPPSTGVMRPLTGRLSDAFWMAGRGWGETVANDLPLSRFDQLWVGGGVQAQRVEVRRTQHSDHRLLYAELRVP